MEINDRFLDPYEYDHLRTAIEADTFPWYYGRKTNHIAQMFDPDLIEKEKYNWHMFNLMYSNGVPMTPEYDLILGLINKIKPRAIIRVKANMTPVADAVREFEMHNDINDDKKGESKTSIYYINDNDGFSLFEDGSKIESVGNRLVTFPESMMHCGTTSTDERRIVINLNYF